MNKVQFFRTLLSARSAKEEPRSLRLKIFWRQDLDQILDAISMLNAGERVPPNENLPPVPEDFEDNGCGPRSVSGIITKMVPDRPFGCCCRQHDWAYHFGGTEDDRRAADWEFLECMWRKAAWYQKPRALMYWRAVRRFGIYSFNYREA